MKQHGTPARLIGLSPREMDMYAPLRFDTGTVYNWYLSIPDTSGNLRFSFIFSPSSVINVIVRGIKKVSDLSADTDNTFIPTRWDSAMIDYAAYLGFIGLDDTRSKENKNDAKEKIADMMRVLNPEKGRHRIMKRSDERGDTAPAWILPSNFGPQSSI